MEGLEGEKLEQIKSVISVETEQKLSDIHQHLITIDRKLFINVTETSSEGKVREWIRGIQSIYGKKNRRNLIVGLSAAPRQRYANSGGGFGPRPKDEPYGLLQICVGSHCPLMEVFSFIPFPRVTRDFLYDNRTIVVGVGIEHIAKKLERDGQQDGLIIRKTVELRKEAEKRFPGNNFERSGLEELAMVVLKTDKLVVVKPKKIKWWDDGIRVDVGPMYRYLSHEMIKYASLEAFLASRMASYLLKDLQ